MGKLIRREIKLPHEIAQKEKIRLEKKIKKSGSWVNLEEPADEINCEEVGATKEDGQQPIRSGGYKMYIQGLDDMVGGNPGVRQKQTILKTQKIRRMYIQKLYDLTFRKNRDREWLDH